MSRPLLLLLSLLLPLTTFAQNSFSTALDLEPGVNTTDIVEVPELGERGAFYRYTAPATTMLSLTGTDGAMFYFYTADHQQRYEYMSTYDADYVYTYSYRVEAGETLYVFATPSWGSTATTLSFEAAMIQGDYLDHGATASDAVGLVSGRTYFFHTQGYLSFVAPDDGMLKFSHSGYSQAASYTTDGVQTEFTIDNREGSFRVFAGKTYLIYVAAYGLFSVTTEFTQPTQGDTKDDPFYLQLGDNLLPAAAQKYYYSYTNGDIGGYLTLEAPGSNISARSAQCGYDDIADPTANLLRIEINAHQTVIFTVDKRTATSEPETLTASFLIPDEGDVVGNPIVLASDPEALISTPKGIRFYRINNTASEPQLLCVKVLSSGVGELAASQLKVFRLGQDYQWSGTHIASGQLTRLQVEAHASRMIYVCNTAATPLEWSAWYEPIVEGDLYIKPITAQVGDNAAAEGEKYYAYTCATTCQLTFTVDPNVATLFFPSFDGDDRYGRDLLSHKGGTYVIAAQAGETVIVRVTAKHDTSFHVAEVAYGAGQSRETALTIEGSEFSTEGLSLNRFWLLYTAPRTGVAALNAEVEAPITNSDNIYFAVNDEELRYSSNLRGTDDDYRPILVERTAELHEGDRLYIYVENFSNPDDLTLTITMRDPYPGETALSAIPLRGNEPNAVAEVGYYDPAVWYTFTTLSSGNVTFDAPEYMYFALYNADMQILQAGKYSNEVSLGGYYGAHTVSLPEGQYFLCMTTCRANNTLTITGVSIAGLHTLSVDTDTAAPAYDLFGRRLTAPTSGLHLRSGQKVWVR